MLKWYEENSDTYQRNRDRFQKSMDTLLANGLLGTGKTGVATKEANNRVMRHLLSTVGDAIPEKELEHLLKELPSSFGPNEFQKLLMHTASPCAYA